MKTTLDQPGVTNEQATAEAKAFVQQLDKALEAYSNEGILVLNSGAAMNKPAANDITANVAANMGIKLQN
ncbi:Type-F conjugative transfer system protein (TrbI_Ftype) [Noviherbaspirillum suwonense]|uniref:Type-F conjugative transfer system protein (TrbI_Ftype) n=2 Tax=Noviherbaspirillum suwonense TaxID=1224511 RepID=A0ABY1QJS3_9BURK|nr:Type-F conjugative transfer system protein (TrbI_Ftype) [Noviherbaspirillum suwonense]